MNWAPDNVNVLEQFTCAAADAVPEVNATAMIAMRDTMVLRSLADIETTSVEGHLHANASFDPVDPCPFSRASSSGTGVARISAGIVESMDHARHLRWDGCLNVRDLGGIPTADGKTTRFGAVIRSDTPDELTAAGWAELSAHGVRTIVDLRHASECSARSPDDFVCVHVPVIEFGDDGFWNAWRWLDVRDTVGFYSAILDRWPERFAQAVSAVARAEPGGVVVHCMVGRDRTGLVSAFLLTLAGAPREQILADYALSAACLQPRYDAWMAAADTDDARQRLRRENVSDPAFLDAVLDRIDVEAYLLAGGATTDDFDAIRRRLLQ
jgi:protein-tyrosine phosphatase